MSSVLSLMRQPLELHLLEASASTQTVYIFDMDGTLLLSPEPTKENYELWRYHTRSRTKPQGEKWSDRFDGWWSRPETLQPPFKIRTIRPTVAAFNKAKRDPNGFVVVMTGRRNTAAMRKAVAQALGKGGITGWDALYLKPPTQDDTGTWKVGMMRRFRQEFPEASTLWMWDDRPSHVRDFRAELKRLGFRGEVHLVNDPRWGSASHMPKNS